MRWQLVDRIDELVEGKSAVGVKCFTLSEPFFADHFPGLDDDAAHSWIRRGRIQAQFGKTQRPRHVVVIGGAEHTRD